MVDEHSWVDFGQDNNLPFGNIALRQLVSRKIMDALVVGWYAIHLDPSIAEEVVQFRVMKCDVDESARVEHLFEVVDQPLVGIGCGIRDVLDGWAIETGFWGELAAWRKVYFLALHDLLDFFAVNVRQVAEGREGGVYGGCLIESQSEPLVVADRGHLDYFGGRGKDDESEDTD